MTPNRGTTTPVTTTITLQHANHFGSFADHEPGLWRAVITQALMDAASASHKPDIKRAKREALSWLLSYSSDFETVCDHAGLDPDYVRGRARIALARNCEWRLPAGLGWRTQGRLTTPEMSTIN
jgi:hypothetical protein